MTAQLSPTPLFRATDGLGFPLYLGRLTTYQAGTLIPQATYIDSTMGTPNTNPVILNARGECNLWLDPSKAYKFALTDQFGNNIPGWPIDNITIGNANPSYNIIPGTTNLYTLGTPAFSWANLYLGPNGVPAFDTITGNVGYIARTPAEIAISVTPVDFFYSPGHSYRYGTNTVPGTTDVSTFINTALNVCRQGGYVCQIPMYETQLVSSSLNVTNCHVLGLGNPWNAPGIQANANQFDILTLTQAGGFAFVVLENLAVDGGNPGGATAGLTGDTVSLKKTSPAHPYVVSIMNCAFNNNKARGIYIERGGYTSIFHAHVLGCGLHGIEVFGTNVDEATTVRDYGSSQYGACPQGFGIKLTEVASVAFRDSILEGTQGIQLNGGDNRSVTFDGVYQEVTTNVSPPQFITDNSSAGVGLSVRGCFGGNTILPYFTNWQEVYFGGGNSNLTESAIPFPNRIIQALSGQFTNAVAGAQSITVATLAVPPGTWDIDATLQCSNGGGANLQDFGMTVTTNIADAGTGSGTATLIPCADRVYASPPTGSGSTVRLKGSTTIQNQTSSNVNYYMRSFINNSAGTLALNGLITAKRLN